MDHFFLLVCKSNFLAWGRAEAEKNNSTVILRTGKFSRIVEYVVEFWVRQSKVGNDYSYLVLGPLLTENLRPAEVIFRGYNNMFAGVMLFVE